jgi:pyruvate formate lyase activating enzyme
MQIKGFIKNSLLEWEGRLAAVLFLPGCNMRCRYCHAGHLILAPDELESVPQEVVFEALREQVGWIDGVAITGGEPTLHGGELVALIDDVRALGFQVMLETNGTRPEVLGVLLRDGKLDAVTMDVKAPLLLGAYRKVSPTDVEMEDLRASIALIMQSGVEHEFRITVVPGLVDEDELRLIGPELDGACCIALQNFRPELSLDPDLRDVPSFGPEQMDALAEILQPYAKKIVVRGRDNAVLATANA